MTILDLTLDMSAIISGAVTVVAILLGALVLRTVLTRLVHRAVTTRIPRIREESQEQLAVRSETLSKSANRLISFAIGVVTSLMVLSELGVDTAPLLASVALASLALGFAAQNIVRDFLNGFFILAEDWYRVGEVAVIAGTGGLVVDVTLRRTVLRDLNGAMHNIPNSQISMGSNLTREWARINLDVSVAYGTDLDHAFRVINEACLELKDDPTWGVDMLTTPKAERVNDFGESGIEIKILGDTKPMRQWALTGELRKRLKERFDQENIEIPWPHTKVYFGNAPAGGESRAG